jgi:hypothetical protein
MLNSHDYLERRIGAAIRERNELSRKRFTIRKLSDPVQQGWRRFFVLTPHAERRKDRATLEAILEVIGNERICRRADFQARRSRSHKLIYIEQTLSRLYDCQWERHGSPAEWRPYFRWVNYKEWGRPRYFGEFKNPSLYELRVEPRLFWHVRDLDPAIETRLHELNSWLDRDGRERRYVGWRGYSSSQWKGLPEPRQKALMREHDRRIRAAMLDPSEADLAASTRLGPISRRSFHPRSPRAEASSSNLEQCECNPRRGYFWNANRTSEPGCFAKAIVRRNAHGEHALCVPPFFLP